MKFSELWLRECVSLDTDTSGLIARMTMAGLEVDGTEAAAAEFAGVVVAEIDSTEAHPQAENLNVCQVSVGDGAAVQVVCGAPNARPGLKVAFATVGSRLPGSVEIGQAELRGVSSFGMLCSAAELGLSEDDAGLLELPDDASIGANLRDSLQLDDTIIEVDLTPNRGDCLSILGLAREAAVLYETTYSIDAGEPVKSSIDMTFPVSLSAGEACPRYAGRVISGLDIGQATPSWMVEKLRRAGLRSIDAVVDVTNYVMLELGQPLHAFDLDKLQGGIDVRYAHNNESLELLGGTSVTLDTKTLVIADQSRPLALAGIMGGAGSGVSAKTTQVFLESAHFNPLVIAGKARQYALHTDSSHRFERGVDPQLPERALERATELLVAIAGGQVGPVSIQEDLSALPAQQNILFRKARLTQQLRLNFEDGIVANILTSLGIEVTDVTDEGWHCLTPSWRFDLSIEADLVEEVARIFGYDKLPVGTPSMPLQTAVDREVITPLSRLKKLMVGRDYREAVTYSFVDEALQQVVSPGVAGIPVTNPISADMNVMRTSLLPGLLAALKHNLNRQRSRLRLFEAGQCFQNGHAITHNELIAGVITGDRNPLGWTSQSEAVDFYDIKGDVEALLTLSGTFGRIVFEPEPHASLQPGQSLLIKDNRLNTVGYVGKLHPNIEKYLGVNQSIYVFELNLETVVRGELPKYVEITRFPSATRDIAVLVDPDVSFETLRDIIESSSVDSLTDLKVFDVYKGKHIENNRKSVALSLTFQHKSRTLSDEEVSLAIDIIVTALKEECSAQLRG